MRERERDRAAITAAEADTARANAEQALAEVHARLASATGEAEVLRERVQSEHARAERAQDAADQRLDERERVRTQFDAARTELTGLAERAADADGRARALQAELDAERRATERETARADRAEARADRCEKRAASTEQ